MANRYVDTNREPVISRLKEDGSRMRVLYPCWNEDALLCQENYLHQFFTRKSSINGKTMPEYDNIVVVEAVNEPIYPTPELIRSLRREKDVNNNPYKQQECQIVNLYDNYLLSMGLADTDDAAQEFCTKLISEYIRRLFDVVDQYFGRSVIKAHIHYGFTNTSIYNCLANSPIDAISVTLYAPCYFDSAYNDQMNPLTELRSLYEYYQPLLNMKKALVCYEFDAPATLTGRAMGAFGYMMAAFGIQIAAQFTYTPVDVSPYNAGWIIHYFNLMHTPSKAAAFIAGGEIFRKTPCGALIPDSDDVWANSYFEVDIKKDRVVYHDDKILIYSASTDHDYMSKPQKIIGIGNSRFIKHQGNGCYILEAVNERQLMLTVFPNQWYVNDPLRGKAYKFMANRYVDTNREWIVSRLREKGTVIELLYPGFESFTAERYENGQYTGIEVSDHRFMADPGQYRITRLL